MLPLEGFRVVEFCNIAAGPFCGMLLSDLGADVIKVEKPDGDDLRYWLPISNGFSENFASLNRNKRSIVLDLKSDADRAIAYDLCVNASIVLENNRPGVMERLGLGFATIAAKNPAIIYCSISAFGQSGPASQEGGFDLTIQAVSGVMSVTGEPGRPPVKCGVPVSDFAAGLYAAYGIAASLLRAQASGKGEHIDISLLGATLGISALQTSEYFGTGTNSEPIGSRHPRNAPYQAFRARDGYFAMAAGNNKLWQSVCDALGRGDLAAREDFATPALRAKNQIQLATILEEQFKNHTAAELLVLFAEAGVPCGPINSFGEAVHHPQVEHNGWVQGLELPGGVKTRTFGSPIVLGGKSVDIRRNPPALNAHAEEILHELAILRGDVK